MNTTGAEEQLDNYQKALVQALRAIDANAKRQKVELIAIAAKQGVKLSATQASEPNHE